MPESGDKRQPRLQDVTRLEKEVAGLREELAEMRGTLGAYSEAAASNPFRGMTITDVERMLILVNVASQNPGHGVSNKAIFDRIQAMESMSKWLSGEEDAPWVVEAKERQAEIRRKNAARALAEKQREENRAKPGISTAAPIHSAEIDAEVARLEATP